jgi:Transcriptional regulator/sugar kinase
LRPRGKVLPEYARAHNRALVLQTLYDAERLSRADLARETGLTRVTISDLVAELISDGLVAVRGHREGSRPGKPAVMLEIDATAHQVIGLDLSEPDRFRGAILDLHGVILHTDQVPLNGSTGDDALAKAVELLDLLRQRTTRPVLGVGVGSPGIVDLAGIVLSAPNLRWTDLPLQQVLEYSSGLPVQVANDANTAALAEHTFGDGFGDVMLVKIGRGVGAGLLIDGVPLFGSRFAAGEIGHVVVDAEGGAPCACGKSGCLETWMSVPSLRAALAEADAAFAEAAAEADAEADAAPSDRDRRRVAVLRAAGEHLGIALAPVVGALNLSEVVLSGPSELLDGPLLDAVIRTVRARTMAEFHGELTVRMATNPDDVVLRGASVLVLADQLGVS